MKKLLLFLLASIGMVTHGQVPGYIAQNFGSFPGFDYTVTTIVTQSDGKILVGGAFSSYTGVTKNCIIRLNSDGIIDTTFNTGSVFNSTVYAIAIQTDGKILVGGDFTSYNGVTENRIIRLNADGTKDTTFNTGTGFNFSVDTIVTQADGKILIGGAFTSYNGTTENRIIRLNSNGTKDTAFNTGTGFNFIVDTIVTQTDGKILVGGNFTSYKGVTENKIIRLNADGTKDTSFNTGTGFNGDLNTVELQTDGKILVGGTFTSYNGVTENRIIRLNADGTKDTAFNTGTGFNNFVWAITTQADGKILVGGNFTSYKGVTEYYTLRLNVDGTKDTDFFTGNGFNGYINTVAKQADGKILVGGNFTSYKKVTENRIIRLNTDGTKDTAFNTGTGFNGYPNTVELQTDGKILVGGTFTSYNGVTENRIIRLNADGTKDTAFNAGTGFNFSVETIVTQDDGKILVGGDFTSYNGTTENRIIRLNSNGTKDTAFNAGTGFNSAVYAITTQTDGKILVGGSFTSYNGMTENRMIRLNTDGTKDTSFNIVTGFNNIVYAITTQTDGKILVGGSFTSYNGITENRIIRLNADGTKDNTFNAGIGFNFSVLEITTQADSKILVGGIFTSYNGLTENRIIRLNADGTKDTAFNTGTGFNGIVKEILIQTSGEILIVGNFSLFNESNVSAYLIALHSEESLINDSFNNSNSINIYPNPVNEILNIDTLDNTTISSIKIYDLQGKLILEDKNIIINVSNLSKGLYIVKISTEEGEITKKFIKE